MSADNWDVCPNCLRQAIAANQELQSQVAESYGKIPIEEFDALRAEAAKGVRDEDFRTFREDYEIYGAYDGVVKVTYSGHCQVCDAGVDFDYQVPVKGIEE